MKKCYFLFIVFTLAIAIQADPGFTTCVENVQSFPNGTLFNRDFGFNYENFNLREPLDYDSTNVSFEGNWPFGYSYSISSNEELDLVFVGSGGGVLVTDVSDPENPVIISEVRARSLVDGSYYDAATQRLYLAAYFSGIEIWDLSDLYNPVFLSRCPTEPYPRGGIYASGDYVFAATVGYGLRIIDVSDPTDPFEVTSITTGNNVWYMKVSGDYAYLVDSSSGLSVVDISDPLNPSIEATYPNATGDIYISGNYAYFAKYGFGLKIYDITDPLNAFEVGDCAVTGYPYRVAVYEDHAFVSGNECGLVAINIADPANPYLVSSNASNYKNIAAVEGNIYITSDSDGFISFDITNPASMQIVGGYGMPGYTTDMAVSGDYVYLGSNGFRVLDVSDYSDPIEVGYAEVDGGCVAVANTHVIYSPKSMGAPNRVNIMNVDDPTNPYREGFYTSPAMTYDLAAKNDLAFVACWWDGMRIIDFSNPSSPYLSAHVLGWTNGAIPGVDYCYVQALDVQGDYAYVIDYGPFQDDDTFGLYIINISDPSNSHVVTRYTNFVSRGWDIDVEGDYAYIADSYGGMEVIDISDPYAPTTISYCYLGDSAQGIHVDGDYAYIANYILGGVQVIALWDPTAPLNVGYYKRSGCFALNVDAEENYVYIADGLSGMQIYNNLLVQVSSEEEIVDLPEMKSWNYPNPFNPSTTISFSVSQTSSFVTLGIYNLKGQKVKNLVNDQLPAGQHSVVWNGKDDNKKSVSSGIYFYKLITEDNTETKKMLLLK
ncbi:MAG: T9SS type A sorting domain-containing protein [Candidatus Cloacimonetes bacterium]|nr:T9SS type A sorting domain-containing protein [Candidatus Cloacimonadota bacterium]MBT4332491.1 T9SS type A sorting domain-containing protein [Candidatus Cloacimonadota bacterium]